MFRKIYIAAVALLALSFGRAFAANQNSLVDFSGLGTGANVSISTAITNAGQGTISFTTGGPWPTGSGGNGYDISDRGYIEFIPQNYYAGAVIAPTCFFQWDFYQPLKSASVDPAPGPYQYNPYFNWFETNRFMDGNGNWHVGVYFYYWPDVLNYPPQPSLFKLRFMCP